MSRNNGAVFLLVGDGRGQQQQSALSTAIDETLLREVVESKLLPSFDSNSNKFVLRDDLAAFSHAIEKTQNLRDNESITIDVLGRSVRSSISPSKNTQIGLPGRDISSESIRSRLLPSGN